ncbi:peptide MFS transporter [Parvularcula maris]|uniref:Oligopeptide:H+ symporter n=1 Tax=Parvularcula maris TaxID=2965077 RepID=A0A9X2RKL6_9PROT|nr:oligopeptide:H+ symporter [Parvularcula maris]MCQ8185913.1 oligopeptide:H+ symporter [Parvularcula maris]
MSETTADRTVGENTEAAGGLVDLTDDKGFLGHPKGLAILFFAEMWERFSFYGMRSLLVLYLVQHFLFSQDKAQGIYAAYGSLVYLTPVIGGLIADRFLGPRRAVLIGAIFLTAGHGLMAFEGAGSTSFIETAGQRFEVVTEGRMSEARSFLRDGEELRPLTYTSSGIEVGGEGDAPSLIERGSYEEVVEQQQTYVNILFLALSLIVVGVGFLKANISTMVGKLYGEKDPRRDPGFTIFYIGINTGSFAAYILCGWLAVRYGWGAGFGAAGIGMALGLLVFVLGKPLLMGRGEPPITLKGAMVAATWIGGIVALAPIYLLIQRDEFLSTVLLYGGPILYIGLLVFAFVAFKAEIRSRMMVAVILTFASVMFWALFEQAGTSLTLYASNNSALPSFLNAAQVGFLNPFYIILLGPVFAWAWMFLARRGMEPSTPVKFSLGIAQVALGFYLLVWGISSFASPVESAAGVRYLVPFVFIAGAYLLHSTGELSLSPVGLSMITKLSAPSVVGVMMGAWFLSSSLGHNLGGIIARWSSTETVGGVVTDSQAQLEAYADTFMMAGHLGLAVAGVVLLLTPLLKRWMAGIH